MPKPPTWPLVIEKDDAKITVTKPRRYDDDGDSESLITVELEGQKFEYSARNIFDFGLVINPVKGGGMAIDVELFVQNNYLKYEDDSDEIWSQRFSWTKTNCQTVEEWKQQQIEAGRRGAQSFRDSHPTPSGWGWDRSRWIPKYEFVWEPMSELEVRAYKLAEENVPNALRGMRM